VLAHLHTTNPAYSVYFSRCPKNNEYSAIVTIREDWRFNTKQQKQKIWYLTTWAAQTETWLTLIDEIEVFDFTNDDFILFDDLSEQLDEKVIEFFSRRRFKLHSDPMHRYVADLTSTDSELSLPEDVYVKSLEPCHAQMMYDLWPHKAQSNVQTIVDNTVDFPSAGLFLKDGDGLVSWIVGQNGMNRLYTVQEYRRRGYADHVTRYLMRGMVQSGYLPFVHIKAENQASISFFQKLGFRWTRTVSMIEATAPGC